MKKLSTPQLQAVQHGCGVISKQAWAGCVVYLFVSLSNDDPSGADAWDTSMLALQSLLEWAIVRCARKFGSTAAQMLRLATTHGMKPEQLHEQNLLPCVFSRRLTPVVYKCATRPSAATSVRLQRRFYSWKHHEQTGLQCPNETSAFVYESRFALLIEAMYTLGHACAVLHKIAKLQPDALQADWVAHALWATTHAHLCSLQKCIWIYLSEDTMFF